MTPPPSAVTGAPKLAPVFSLLVGGHRQARLQRHWLNGDTARLRQSTLEDDLKAVMRYLAQAAEQAFNQGSMVYLEENTQFRLITGQADGVDQMASHLAKETGYERHLLVPRHASDAPRPLAAGERGVAMQMTAPDDRPDLDDSLHQMRDQLALSFADWVIAVWDGKEPSFLQSGTAQLIREALLRRTPVVLLYLDGAKDRPQIMITRPERLTDAWRVEAEVLGAGSTQLLSVFEPFDEFNSEAKALIQEWMVGLLLPFLPALDPSSTERQLLQRIQRQKSVSRYGWQWLQWWLKPKSRNKNEPPLAFFDWVKGSWLWLNIMLNPPQKSQPLRVLEALQTDVRAYTWQESLVSRAHGFFSSLAKLEFKRAWLSLRRAPCQSRYRQAIHPADAIAAEHPIKEPALEQVFNWSDAQAQVFSNRYRDDTWMIYYAAAFAVFCAVAGAIHLWPAPKQGIPFIWVLLEFVLLHFIVRRVLKARFKDYHGQWMNFRFIAEQIRYLRLGYPLLVLPSAFSTPVWEPPQTPAENSSPIELKSAEAWILQRLLVAEGLPESASGGSWYGLTEHNPETLSYIRSVLEEHRSYYLRSYHNLHHDHVYLHKLAFGLFTLTFFAVTIHFFYNLPGILIFTAFFPAWGAAIHGILSQNEVVRVSSMAAQVWQELTTLTEAFDLHEQMTHRFDQQQGWERTQELRELVTAAAKILSNENQYWRSLFQHNHPSLPA